MKHKVIHNQLFKVAKLNHPSLASLIKANGIVQLNKSRDRDLFRFLARTVIEVLSHLSVSHASNDIT